jgi:hypothetical protein
VGARQGTPCRCAVSVCVVNPKAETRRCNTSMVSPADQRRWRPHPQRSRGGWRSVHLDRLRGFSAAAFHLPGPGRQDLGFADIPHSREADYPASRRSFQCFKPSESFCSWVNGRHGNHKFRQLLPDPERHQRNPGIVRRRSPDHPTGAKVRFLKQELGLGHYVGQSWRGLAFWCPSAAVFPSAPAGHVGLRAAKPPQDFAPNARRIRPERQNPRSIQDYAAPSSHSRRSLYGNATDSPLSGGVFTGRLRA